VSWTGEGCHDLSNSSLAKPAFEIYSSVNQSYQQLKTEKSLATAVVSQSLFSYFVRQGIVDIAKRIISDKPNDARIPALEKVP
jgi:hypothetical protein